MKKVIGYYFLIMTFLLWVNSWNWDPFNEKPIELLLGSDEEAVQFNIPTHYIYSKKHYIKNNQLQDRVFKFTIELRLPDLVPESVADYEAKKSGLSKENQRDLRRLSKVRVVVMTSRDYSQMRNLQSSILPDEVRDSMNFEEVYDLLDLGEEMRFSRETVGTATLFEGFRNAGIKFSKRSPGDITKVSSFGRRYFVPKKPSDKEGFYIECVKRNPEVPITYCTIKKDLGSSIRVEIGFSFDNFPNWKVVDQKVTDFLKSHMVDK